MASVRGRDTRPEILVRSALHRLGFRFRVHLKDLPGKPDIVLPRYRAVIFVHGCFWHGHDCHLFSWPKSRREYWGRKLLANAARDHRQLAALREAGWRVAVVRECALKGRTRLPPGTVATRCAAWLRCGGPELEIAGIGAAGPGRRFQQRLP